VAASFTSPYIAADEIKLAEAVQLLRETPHPIALSTLERLCRRNGVPLVKYGRANHASWSKLLQLHRDWVLAKN
jgi:hypothetical protein